MTIEFSCPNCGKTLQVGDENAGKQARCPSCQQVAQIPATSTPPINTGGDTENPFASPAATDIPRQTPPAAQSGQLTNVPVEAGVIINYAFEIWKSNLGLLVGVFFVVALIVNGITYGFIGIALAMQADEGVALMLQNVGTIIANIFSIYLGIGQVQICLKLVRGQPAEFGDLFAGGSRFLPALGISLLLGLAIFAGFLLCIVPGVFLMLMWWPAYYLVIDEKSDVMESFTFAKMITTDNYGNAFVLWLASMGIILLGFLALCVGVFFAAPLVGVMWATAYLMMSGQLAVK